ncbi:MAG TPA: SDR family oxidoreductase [Alphaproteobacteria bacterium]|nr:SDR family oxidoreductase [Alphaproteobacteria bacterium]
MDLGIAGKKAIVCAASKGLGRACAFSLAREGVEVTIAARTKDVLEATAADIRAKTGAKVHAVACDVTTEAGRSTVLKACPAPDILVNNAGGPPPGDFREWGEAEWLKALNNNMVTAILLIKASVDGMIARRFGRVVNITSAAVKHPIWNLGLSNGARAGLTGFIAGLARTTGKHNVTINNLLPGHFETDRMRANVRFQAEKLGRTFEEQMAQTKAANPSGRVGDPAEFGDACAYLCSAQAGFITGQNFLLDGGAYPGTL